MDRIQLAALVVTDDSRRWPKNDSDPSDPLAPIAGVSVLGWVVDSLLGASVRRIAVIGSGPHESARAELAERADKALVHFVSRGVSESVDIVSAAVERLGTELTLRDSSHLLVVCGECPQLESSELRELVDEHVYSASAATTLGWPGAGEDGIGDPVVERDDDGYVASILDPLGSSPADVTVACFRAPLLIPALRRVTPSGWAGRLLIDDAIAAIADAGHPVSYVPRAVPLTAITDPISRSEIETSLRERVVRGWVERGVAIGDPRQVSIDATVTIGKGVQILPGTVIEGLTVVGDGAVLGPNSHIVDSVIGTGAVVPTSVVHNSEIAPHAVLDPFTVEKA